MKTMSESTSASAIFSVSSSAARWPIDESPPAPRPRVILSPIRILCGASAWRSACASVLQGDELDAHHLGPDHPVDGVAAAAADADDADQREVLGVGTQRHRALLAAHVGILARRWLVWTRVAFPGAERVRWVGRSIRPTGLGGWPNLAVRASFRPRSGAPVHRPATGPRRHARSARDQRKTDGPVVVVGVRIEQAIDCHVPSPSRPATTGTVSDGGASSGST